MHLVRSAVHHLSRATERPVVVYRAERNVLFVCLKEEKNVHAFDSMMKKTTLFEFVLEFKKKLMSALAPMAIVSAVLGTKR